MEQQQAPSTYAPTVWGRFRLAWDATQVMGIVNVTPDSFSGDGLATSGGPADWAVAAAARAAQQVADGARIIDIGGASSRPGAPAVAIADEIARIVPAIQAVAAAIPPAIPIAVDAWRAPVVQVALAAGATMINDIRGLRGDPDLAALAAAAGVPVVLMANRRGMARSEVISDLTRLLAESIEIALAAGVAWERLIVDPGFGFGLTPAENLTVLRRLGAFAALGRPILLGASRKATLGKLTGGAAADLDTASLAAAVVGALRGARIIRAHAVRATVQALRVADAAR